MLRFLSVKAVNFEKIKSSLQKMISIKKGLIRKLSPLLSENFDFIFFFVGNS